MTKPAAGEKPRHKLRLIERELWTLNEVAAILRTSRQTLREMVDQGMFLKPVSFGPFKRRVWRGREIMAWVEAGLPDPRYWVWKPTKPQTLDEVIQQSNRTIASLKQELRILTDQVNKLENRAQELRSNT